MPHAPLTNSGKENECRNEEHRKSYLHTCKECFYDEEKRGDEPYYRLDTDGQITEDRYGFPVWCVCPAKCNHNVFTCTICWLPVAMKLIDTPNFKQWVYWYV